ncbi:hypothetical protein [Ottowia sp.]|uniref:glycosyltransferase family 39 protein n=1 Tax=Ottowia sp. TaxID=1898956 RepID=UPI0026117945|nr:hypothetical protein [Ottowia sp.]
MVVQAGTRRGGFLLAVMVLLVLLGGWLRLHDLGAKSLWADELFSVSVAHDHPFVPDNGQPVFERLRILDVTLGQSFLTAKGADQSPPLFELLDKASIALLGLNEFSARFPSALAGCLLLAWLGWRWARAADGTERAVFGWALLLCALDPVLVRYAQEARVYSTGTLLAGMLCGWWFLRWHRGLASSPLPGWGEIAVFVLACYGHNNLILLSAILLASYGLEALRRGDWRAIARLAVVPLAFLPWVWLSWHTMFFTMDRGIAWVQFTWAQAWAEALRSTDIVFLRPWIWLVCAAALAAGLWRGGAWWRGDSGVAPDAAGPLRAFPWLTALAMLLLILVYDALVSAVVARTGVYHYRHIIFMVPAMAMLGGVLFSTWRRPWVHALLVLAVVAAAVQPIRATFAEPKTDVRGAYRFVLDRVPPDAPVVGITPADRRFYLDVLAPGAPHLFLPLSVYEPVAYGKACERLRARGAAAVGLVTYQMRAGFIDDLYSLCSDAFERADTFHGNGVVAEVWLRREPAGPPQSPEEGDAVATSCDPPRFKARTTGHVHDLPSAGCHHIAHHQRWTDSPGGHHTASSG